MIGTKVTLNIRDYDINGNLISTYKTKVQVQEEGMVMPVVSLCCVEDTRMIAANARTNVSFKGPDGKFISYKELAKVDSGFDLSALPAVPSPK